MIALPGQSNRIVDILLGRIFRFGRRVWKNWSIAALILASQSDTAVSSMVLLERSLFGKIKLLEFAILWTEVMGNASNHAEFAAPR